MANQSNQYGGGALLVAFLLGAVVFADDDSHNRVRAEDAHPVPQAIAVNKDVKKADAVPGVFIVSPK